MRPQHLARAAEYKEICLEQKMMSNRDRGPAIVYDGDCPFCSHYVRLVRLKKSLGHVDLVDARAGGPIVDEVFAAGFDLDDGMVLKMDGRFYHGEACINRLALLSTPSDGFNRLNRLIFTSRTASGLLYPVLRLGRNAALRLLGRKRLNR
jgi:predicted DCC family thiol-disulfide oxidoreductase YuxK